MVGYIRTTPAYQRPARDAKGCYADRRWRKYALEFVKRYPLCVVCACQGKINDGATRYASGRQRNLVVDHITPHKGDDALYWDSANHQTLCRYPCHDAIKQAHERGGKNASQWWEWLRSQCGCGLSEPAKALMPAHVIHHLGGGRVKP